MAEWFRALMLKYRGPGFEASTLPQVGFVSRQPRVQILGQILGQILVCLLSFHYWPTSKIAKLSACIAKCMTNYEMRFTFMQHMLNLFLCYLINLARSLWIMIAYVKISKFRKVSTHS